ncbi:hypothetical protein D9M72_621700 [compost metagenome]
MTAVGGLQQGQFLKVVQDEVREAGEDLLAVAAVGPGPRTRLERPVRRLNGVVHVLLPRCRHLRGDGAVTGRDRGECFAVPRFPERAVNVDPGGGRLGYRPGDPVLLGCHGVLP